MTLRGRQRRSIQDIVQQPWMNFINPLTPQNIVSDDELESIHLAALKILENIGLRCLYPEALHIMKKAGCKVDDTGLIKMGRETIEQALSTVPAEFELTPRNPAKKVRMGGRHFTTAGIYGPPACKDLIRGRRTGTLADLRELLKLTQFFNVQQVNGYVLEPQDVDLPSRHLEATFAQLTLTDKVPCILCQGKQRVIDALTLCAMARGESLEQFTQRPGVVTIINSNTPLQYDLAMAMGVIEMARYGQVTFISPFVMAGASTPATVPSAMTMVAAEVLFGVVLAQAVNPGAPIVFGNVATGTDMRTGSPAYGFADMLQCYLLGGQLARRYKMPMRVSNYCSSNVADYCAGFESANSLQTALAAQGNVWMHMAGWTEGGLCTSYEKFVLDCELVQNIIHMIQPLKVDDDSIAYDEIAEIGPGGHFFGQERTLKTVESAFYRPLISITQNNGAWLEAGGKTAEQRATAVWQEALAKYEQPPLDPAITEQMTTYMTRRRAEGGAPIE